jgi:hypothetical protein
MAFELKAKQKDLGGFSVRRILPHAQKRTVGPFVFFDHMGPAEFPPGAGVNVRPHPHIGLATVTYLLEGSILHRDSLGNVQEIFPGDVNWMTAGHGIVHSERESMEVRASVHRLNGFQVWLALPPESEEVEPAFFHVGRNELPHRMDDGVTMRLVAGEAYAMESPVRTFSPMFYVDVLAKADRRVERPNIDMETAAYVQVGEVEVSGERFGDGAFIILDANDRELNVTRDARLMLLGGEALEHTPHLDWNFVSHDPSRIERARKRWREGRFPRIPGDDIEYIPLPDQ